MARGLVAAAVVLVGMTTAGCGESSSPKPRDYDWDLSRSHTMHDVDWPHPDTDAVRLTDVGSVRLRFGGGEVFDAGEAPATVNMTRDGPELQQLQLDTAPLTPPAAAKQARTWAKRFDLPTKPIDSWEQLATSGHRSAAVDKGALTTGTPDERVGGRDGPVVSVKILDSFNDQRPSFVSVGFAWLPLPAAG